MANPMRTSQNGIAVMHHYESCKLRAYPDPATGGAPWTIGWGHTGPEVRPGLVWDQSTADVVFAQDLQRFEIGVVHAVNVPVTQGQFDAMVSLAYNIGLGNFRSSTLLKMLNSGNPAGAADQFLRWNKAAGKVMLGLSRRRESERALFQGQAAQEAIRRGGLVK